MLLFSYLEFLALSNLMDKIIIISKSPTPTELFYFQAYPNATISKLPDGSGQAILSLLINAREMVSVQKGQGQE